MTHVRMHVDEIDLDATLVRQLLRAQMPEWADLPIARVASSGTDNAMFRLGDDMVVRMPRVERGAEARQRAEVAAGARAAPSPRDAQSAREGRTGPGLPLDLVGPVVDRGRQRVRRRGARPRRGRTRHRRADDCAAAHRQRWRAARHAGTARPTAVDDRTTTAPSDRGRRASWSTSPPSPTRGRRHCEPRSGIATRSGSTETSPGATSSSAKVACTPSSTSGASASVIPRAISCIAWDLFDRTTAPGAPRRARRRRRDVGSGPRMGPVHRTLGAPVLLAHQPADGRPGPVQARRGARRDDLSRANRRDPPGMSHPLVMMTP